MTRKFFMLKRVHLEGLQVPGIHSNDLCIDGDGLVQTIRAVDLHEAVHSQVFPACIQGLELPDAQHLGDEQEGIGTQCPAGLDLPYIHDKIFHHDGQAAA